jgi:thiamine-phosphate pyrophosphorylase
MPLPTTRPLSYLVTPGETTRETTPDGPDFTRLLALVSAAGAASVSLVQLREKNLRPRVLYELAARSVELLRGTPTRLFVNDRADVARAAGAAGVHLTTRSLDAATVRRAFGPDFLIGVSAHTPDEARAARDGGADFAVFGPVFDTPSKCAYGPPAGLDALAEVARALAPFPVLAIGGVTRESAPRAILAGAAGVAAIRLFADAETLREVVTEIGRAPLA